MIASGPLRVLIVDANEDTRAGLVRLFGELLGLRAEAVATIAEAEAGLLGTPPDGMMVAAMLPDGSGIEFVARVRAAAPATRCMVAGPAGETLRRAATSKGAVAYLDKPLTPRSIVAALGLRFNEYLSEAEIDVEES